MGKKKSLQGKTHVELSSVFKWNSCDFLLSKSTELSDLLMLLSVYHIVTKPQKNHINIVIDILSFNTWKILPFLLWDFQYCSFFHDVASAISAAILCSVNQSLDKYRFESNAVSQFTEDLQWDSSKHTFQ